MSPYHYINDYYHAHLVKYHVLYLMCTSRHSVVCHVDQEYLFVTIQSEQTHSLVRLQLEYAAMVWSPWQSYLIQNIEKVQHHAARYVTNNYSPYISVSHLLQSLGWETLESCRTNERLSMLYKMIINKL